MIPDLTNLVSEFHRGDVRYRKAQVLAQLDDIFQHVDDFEGGALEVLFDDLPYFLQIADQEQLARFDRDTWFKARAAVLHKNGTARVEALPGFSQDRNTL